MQSPFQIFRKHQKMLIVVLTGLAMFAFILLDSVQNMSSIPPTLMVFIGAVLLGGAFWIFGLQGGKGKQVEYGLTGAVVGVAIGLAFMFFSKPTPVVETSAGRISAKELREMVDRRALAVRFMRNAFQSSVPEPRRPPISRQQLASFMQSNPQIASSDFFRNIIQQHEAYDQWQIQQFQATFPLDMSGRDRMSTERDAVLRFLLLKEAKELGIKVDNEAVNAYIKRVTNDQMSQAIFNNIRTELQVSKAKLYDILREEIAAQIVLRLQRPESMRIVTPGEYWEQYRKLNIRQKMEYVPVEVKEFTARVSEPSETELKAFFDKYKDKAPTEVASADPAFGLPERVQLAYFKGDFEIVEADVLKRMDQEYLSPSEITAVLKEIDEAVADVQQQIKAGTIKKELAEKELIDARREQLRKLLTSGNKVRRFDYEIVRHYEENKKTQYQNPAWKAAHPGGPAKKDPFLDGPELKFPTKKPGGESPEARDAKKKPDTKPGGGKKTAAESAKKTKDEVSSPAPKFPKQPAKDNTPKDNKKPKNDTSGAMRFLPQPLFGPASFTALLTQPAKSDSKAKPAKSTPVASPKKPVAAKRPEKTSPQFPELPPPPALPQGPPPPPFRELNEDLRSRIRDDLLKEKVQEEIRVRLRKAAAAMEAYRTKYLAWLENPEREFDRVAVSAALKEKAKELGLNYVVTGLFGELEFLRDASKYPMNDAFQVFDLAEPSLRQQHRRVSEVLFPRRDENNRTRNASLYSVILAKEFRGQEAFATTGDMYVLWKTAHEEPKTPKFEDKGIREEVLKAWRQVHARPLAEKRALELATLVREAKRPMEDVLAGKTVTGKPGDPPLMPERVRDSFTWLTTDQRAMDSSAPPLGFHQLRFGIAPTDIKGVKLAGKEFREYVFETLKDGEVGVTPNADQSVYYVVRVLDRQGTSPEGRRHHIQQLLESQPTADQSLRYAPLKTALNPVNQKLINETMDRLYKKYDVKFNRRLDKTEVSEE